MLQGITEDFQDLGHDEKHQTQFTLHQDHFSSSQPLQETRHVEACQQGPDQCRQRNRAQPVEKKDTGQTTSDGAIETA